jgi:hypothetical protein
LEQRRDTHAYAGSDVHTVSNAYIGFNVGAGFNTRTDSNTHIVFNVGAGFNVHTDSNVWQTA